MNDLFYNFFFKLKIYIFGNTRYTGTIRSHLYTCKFNKMTVHSDITLIKILIFSNIFYIKELYKKYIYNFKDKI